MEPPAAPAPAAPTGPLADLILVRLLPAKTAVSQKKLRADLAPLFHRPPSAEQVADAIGALQSAGLLALKGVPLTDAGRGRALAYLGITDVPPNANWGTVKSKYLVPKALGLSPASATNAKVLGDAKRLASLLLRRKFDLPAGTPNTLPGVFEALACRLLGFPDHLTLKAAMPAVISREKGYDPPLTRETLMTVGPRLLLDTPKSGVAGLRAQLLAGWADRDPVAAPTPEAAPPNEPFDLEMFANTVRAAARGCPTGRFGANKVFINHVWRELQDQPQIAPLGLDGFKDKLVEANRENRLTLSRADMSETLPPDDLDASETRYLNAAYHFILTAKE
jgi:hypothetical protein